MDENDPMIYRYIYFVVAGIVIIDGNFIRYIHIYICINVDGACHFSSNFLTVQY